MERGCWDAVAGVTVSASLGEMSLNTGPRVKAKGECRVRVVKDEKRAIMEDKEECY